MMRPHCDRCDKLCDEYPRYVEDNTSPIDANGEPRNASSNNPIWHISIASNSTDRMFCRDCWIAILEQHVAELKGVLTIRNNTVYCNIAGIDVNPTDGVGHCEARTESFGQCILAFRHLGLHKNLLGNAWGP